MSLLVVAFLALQSADPWSACTTAQIIPANPNVPEVVRRYAPVLSFAPGEGFFPTIPFFTALDGDSAGGDAGKADLEDPWEIAPYLKSPGSQEPVDTSVDLSALPVSWKELLRAYHPDTGPVRPQGPTGYSRHFALHRVVVLYRVCSLSDDQNKNLERYIRSDEQAFERFQQVRTFDAILKKPSPDSLARFDVIQYFLYYLADRGLKGHPNDIELVSVFLPRKQELRDKFRVVVGSGHATRTPNNVLVLSSFHRGESSLQDTLHVLVELGGHSSAPDLRPIGRFTPGLDANWHAYDLWGTRDAQASSGIGYLGQYRQSMTFDRGFGSDGIYVYPQGYTEEEAAAEVETIKGVTEQVAAPANTSAALTDTSAARADSSPTTPTAAKPPKEKPASGRLHSDSAHIYRLLPMHLLIHVDSALNDTTNTAEVILAVSRLQRALCPRPLDSLTGPCKYRLDSDTLTWSSADIRSLSEPDQNTAIRIMRRWKLGMNRDTAYTPFEPRNQNRPGLPRVVEFLSQRVAEPENPGHHRPWDHQSFRGQCKDQRCDTDPTEVLKAHLFRPNTYTVEKDGWGNLLLLGMTAAPTDGWELYSGIVVPAFRTHAVPVRFAGFLELHAGINCRFWGCAVASPTLGILYEAHRNSYVSWYATGKWVPRRSQVIENPDAGEFTLSGGISLLPIISDHRFRLINVIRVRAGIRFDPLRGEDLLGRVRYELNLAIRQ